MLRRNIRTILPVRSNLTATQSKESLHADFSFHPADPDVVALQ
jgi:hypothetical protein